MMNGNSIYKRYTPAVIPRSGNHTKAWLFIFNSAKMLVKEIAGEVSIPMNEDVENTVLSLENKRYFGELDGIPCYCVEVYGPEAAGEGLFFKDLRSLLGRIEEDIFLLAGRAYQIVNWHRMNKFCGKCSAPTETLPNELAKKCPNCASVFYPRISPAVIVAVFRQNEILLAHNKNFRPNWYSVIAGFVEPGETFEDCVVREVMEEVGIKVRNVSYFGSQPWPFPDSLMVGFTAEYESGDILVDGEEIDSAGWYNYDNLPPCPTQTSIAGRLIDFVVSGRRLN